MCLTKKQQRFVYAIERNTRGLTAVTTGICPGCEQCRDEYGRPVKCSACDGKGYVIGDLFQDQDCPICDGTGQRPPTMEEFEEQWSTQEALCEPSFSWSGCDLCDSTLGGNMEPWHAVDANNEIIHGEHACVDCVLYLANGDLP